MIGRTARRGLLAAGVAVLVSATAAPVRAQDWKLAGDKEGIQIYRREVPGSGVVAVKGVGAIDAPLWKIASILLDTARAPEWVDSLKESRVVRRLAPDVYIEYNHIGMPLIIRDREFVSEVKIDVNASAHEFALLYHPTTDTSVPATHNVRGEILAGRFQAVSIQAGARTELTAEVQADPKGLLPTWLVNFFQKNWPIETFEAVRKQAAKPDISMPAAFKDVLEPTRAF